MDPLERANRHSIVTGGFRKKQTLSRLRNLVFASDWLFAGEQFSVCEVFHVVNEVCAGGEEIDPHAFVESLL